MFLIGKERRAFYTEVYSPFPRRRVVIYRYAEFSISCGFSLVGFVWISRICRTIRSNGKIQTDTFDGHIGRCVPSVFFFFISVSPLLPYSSFFLPLFRSFSSCFASRFGEINHGDKRVAFQVLTVVVFKFHFRIRRAFVFFTRVNSTTDAWSIRVN